MLAIITKIAFGVGQGAGGGRKNPAPTFCRCRINQFSLVIQVISSPVYPKAFSFSAETIITSISENCIIEDEGIDREMSFIS